MADCSESSPAESISKVSSSSIVIVGEKGSRGNLFWVTRTYTKRCTRVTRTFQLTSPMIHVPLFFQSGPLLLVCRQPFSVFSTAAVLLLFGGTRHHHTRNQVAADL